MPDRTRARLKRQLAEAASGWYNAKRRVAEAMSVRSGVRLKWCLADDNDDDDDYDGRWVMGDE